MIAATPTRLGRYQILEEIGKGAMGVVYLAKDPLIGRLVALKTFRMGDAQDQEMEESRQRFMREAQSAGILSHPNIVTIHDVVEEAAERLTFIAMEFVRGTDLKELLRRGESFDPPAVADIIWQVAEALEYAHSKGVVHRDIKPANILITGDGRVKLTDFGIARLNTSDLTHDGQLLGTPNYMAPEQVQGKDVDHRADIFSLGVVLYELLTHQKPFRGDNLTVVTHRIVYEPFTPPEEYVGQLPPALTAVLHRALAKSPEERYQRVGELARDLREAVTAESSGPSLNDTQQVRARAGAAPAEPAAAAPPATSPPAAAATPGDGGGRAGGLAAPVRKLVGRLLAAAAPLLPPRDRRPPPLRAALVASLALATGLLGAWLVLALVAPESHLARDLVTDAELQRRYEYLPLVWQGRNLLRDGDPAAAVEAFAAAERIGAGEPRLAELRREAEREVQEMEAQARKAEEAEEILEQGREAFARRRYQDAATAAGRALVLVPDHPGAQELQARAEVALGRGRESRQARAPTPRASAPPRPAPATGAAAGGGEEAAVPAVATLKVSFYTEVSEGVLTLYADQEQLLREEFRFTEKVSFFRSRGVPGGLEREVEMRPGATTLRVYVALDKTRTESIQGNFPAGVTRTLTIRVAASGELDVTLR